MDIYDSEAVQKVWQRVLQKPGTEIPETALEDWIASCMGARRSYLAMAGQSRRLGRLFRTMAAEEAAHIRKLQGLRWLLYGRRDQIFSGSAEGKRDFHAALRSRYEAEQAAVREYRTAAQRYPQQEALFLTLAEDAERHCRLLQRAAEGLA